MWGCCNPFRETASVVVLGAGGRAMPLPRGFADKTLV